MIEYYGIALYCDNPACKIPSTRRPHQISGVSDAGCEAQAKQMGWRINAGKTALCPGCAKGITDGNATV